MQSINELTFTEKVLLKSLRFTELSHETEVLNYGHWGHGIVKPNSEANKALCRMGEQLTLHSKKNVYVYSISASCAVV